MRLLLRSARKRLSTPWEWGESDGASLHLHDESRVGDDTPTPSVAGADARIIAETAPAPTGLFLRRPLNLDAFIALLEAVATATHNSPAVTASAATETDQAAATPHSHAGSPIDPDTPSAPSPAATSATAPAPDRSIAPDGEHDALRPLLYFLPKRVLGGPARIERKGAPALTIDPESRTFFATGTLPELELYSREPLRYGDWQRLTDSEMEALRKTVPARSILCLTWMDTYVHSGGVLSRRLDPEGTYAVTRRLDLANDYPHALRISTQMARPRRLDAIARACGVGMAEVHDVVNAFEAIGYLDWTRAGTSARRT